jgi:pimeloyl-ACP methyl ester carboxylesterase
MKNLLSISAISFCFILFGCSCSSTQTHRFKSANEKILQNSIASLEKISIGGVDQWILIRGVYMNNPILFKLHGGPGQAEMATANYNHDLEEHFIVVEWDQRGAGKSYRSISPKSAMNLNQLVEDTREISEYLLKRFNQNKLILVGHSWGSILGIMAVQKYPQLYKAFVSTGQIVNMGEGVKISYKHLMDSARIENNDQALTELTEIGEPPFNDKAQNERRTVYNKWMKKFGADWHGKEPLPRVKIMLSSIEYSLSEKLHFQSAAKESFDILNPDLMKVDLFNQVKKVQVPVYFAIGRFDYRTPSELSLKYLDSLEAPLKKWKWFENSSHFPQLEEPNEFCNFLINTVLVDIK